MRRSRETARWGLDPQHSMSRCATRYYIYIQRGWRSKNLELEPWSKWSVFRLFFRVEKYFWKGEKVEILEINLEPWSQEPCSPVLCSRFCLDLECGSRDQSISAWRLSKLITKISLGQPALCSSVKLRLTISRRNIVKMICIEGSLPFCCVNWFFFCWRWQEGCDCWVGLCAVAWGVVIQALLIEHVLPQVKQ